MSERATERDEEHPLDFPPESEVPDDLFGIILHSAWILTFARSCEWKNVRAEIDQLAKEVHRLRAASTDAPTEECDHRRQWCDLVPPGSGTISCRDCGAVLFNRYGPDGDKIPEADAAPDRGGRRE